MAGSIHQKRNVPVVKDAELSGNVQISIALLEKVRYTLVMERLESFPKYTVRPQPDKQEEKQ